MQTETISILGLGRVGASIGLAIKQSPLDLKVVGYEADGQTAKRAKEMGAVDRTRLNMINTAAEGDIVVLALPLAELEEALQLIGRDVKGHAVVLDTAALKTPVQRWADNHLEKGHYVAVRPVFTADALTDTRLGVEAASADLFRNSVFCLMPSPTVDEAAVQTANAFARLLGAEAFFLDAAEHDAYAQGLETVPALMSAALFRTLTGSAGWRDILRFSGLSFAQATSSLSREGEIATMAFQDKGATLRWLDDLINNLIEMRRWVSDGDEEVLGALLTELNVQREEWLHERRENNWNEAGNPDVDRPSFMQQFFIGGLGRKADKDDKGKR